MAARPQPTPQPHHEKTDPTGTPETSVKQKVLQMIRTVSKAPANRERPHAVMKKRWLRIAGIAVAVFLLPLIALPFLINVNSFRPG